METGTLGISLAWVFLLLAGLPVFYILLLTLAAFIPQRTGKPITRQRRMVILIPAHNESLLIQDTVRSALAQNYRAQDYAVMVVADNCSDDTAALARSAGARVLERSQSPGKGQALFEALGLLMQEGWDAFLMMDADSHLHPDTLSGLNQAIEDGAQAVQIRYGVLNPNDNTRTRAMELSTASFNALRPRGKASLGLSAGIYGNGFCLTRDVVKQVPYLAHSIVEDIEYHMHLLQARIRVSFLDEIWVKAQMPLGGRGSEVQRVRWERGRIITLRHYAPKLFGHLLRGNFHAVDALLDILMPPVSIIALAMVPVVLFGNQLQIQLTLLLVITLYLHYVIAAWRYGSLPNLFRLSLYIPQYFAWKTWIVAKSLITERNLPWIRTDRHKHDQNIE